MSCKCYSLKGQEPVCGKIQPDSDYIFGCSSQICGDCSQTVPVYGHRADEAPLLYVIMLILVIISTIVSILEA